MATYTVTTASDGVVAPAGSLREAIAAANANPGADTIVFDAALNGQTITLAGAAALPTITESLTITGQGADKTVISGADASRVLVIASAGAPTVRIELLTLTHGRSATGGGALYNAGNTTLDHVAITDSTGTGLGSGGVYNTSTGVMTLSNSTLSGNTATGYFAGGLLTTGALSVINSTFYNNTAQANGAGAIFIQGAATTTTIQNSTFVNNSAPQGGAIMISTASAAVTTISNSIFSGNTATFGSAIWHSSGPAPTVTYNLIEGTYGAVAVDATNVTGAAATAYTPGAATLVGGLGVFIPAYGSAVVDKGGPAYSGPPVDALGNTRVFGGRVDMGAVEDQTVRPIVVAPPTPTAPTTPAPPPTVAPAVTSNAGSVLGSPGTGVNAPPATVTTPSGQVLPNPILEQQKAINALIAKVDAGTLTLKAAQDIIVDMADGTTSVAAMGYQFFTGKLPTKAGLAYLVSSPENPTDLNDGYYAGMSLENRYINFAVNLGKVGEGSAAFTANYGALSLTDATAKAYAEIFGAPAPGKVAAILTPERTAYFASLGGDALGQKAAMVGWLLGEAAKTDTGPYAARNENFLYDLLDGTAAFGADAHIYAGAGPTTIGLIGMAGAY